MRYSQRKTLSCVPLVIGLTIQIVGVKTKINAQFSDAQDTQ